MELAYDDNNGRSVCVVSEWVVEKMNFFQVTDRAKRGGGEVSNQISYAKESYYIVYNIYTPN